MNLHSLDIESLYPQLKNKITLIAVSGGVDSVVLSHLFSNTNLKFSIAHCNYCLRSQHSDKDETLVKDLASRLNVKLFHKKFNTIEYSKINKCSIQMAAREIRYNWFEKLLIQNHISFISTAHHLNDQLETFLINIARGSGIEGLVGISESSKLIRPLLNFTKEEILDYAKLNKLKWNEDQSNINNTYLRNSIRNKVVPEFKKILPNIEKQFQKSIHHIGLANIALKSQIDSFKLNFFIKTDTGIKIHIKDLESLYPNDFFLHAIFKKYGFNSSTELLKLINSSPGKLISSTSHDLLRDRECLILRNKSQKKNDFTYQIKLFPQKLKHPFEIEISLKPFIDSTNSIEVDFSLSNLILEIKKPYSGAFFYPKGMSGKKKLSKFFKDEKLSKFEKENQWILTYDDQVVWVIGRRADSRFISKNDSSKRMYIRMKV